MIQFRILRKKMIIKPLYSYNSWCDWPFKTPVCINRFICTYFERMLSSLLTWALNCFFLRRSELRTTPLRYFSSAGIWGRSRRQPIVKGSTRRKETEMSKNTKNYGSSSIIINTPDVYLRGHSSDGVQGSHSCSQSALFHSRWVHSLEWSARSRLFPSPWPLCRQTGFWRITEQTHWAGRHTQGGRVSA